MFKAVSRFVVKTGAVGIILVTLVAISAIFATASVADAATATVKTTHWKSSTGEGYTLNFTVPNPDGNVNSVSLTGGTGVSSPVTLTVVDPEVSTNFTGSLELTAAPSVGAQYQLDVTYLDGTPADTATATVDGVVAQFATPTAPLGGVASSSNPTFTWSAPSAPPAGSYNYQVSISGNDGSWQSSAIASGTTSYLFPSATFSPKSAPTTGVLYDWVISVVDANGNRSENRATFMTGTNFKGKVTDLAGNGVSGVAVLVYTSTGVSVDANANDIVTQAGGSYIYGGLSAGNYKVKFSKGTSTVWYNNKLGTFSDGDLVVLASGVITSNVDGVMDSWGAIAGKATTSTGTAISGVKAELYTTGNVLVASIPSVTTKTDGTYLFSLIPPGNYKVKLTGVAQGYAEQWANSGSAITVTSGNTTDVYPTAMPTINFSGTVTDINNSPVAGIWVYLYTDKNNASSLYYGFAGTRTQADGTYAVGGVPAGTYYVLFSTTGTGYEKQYYNRKASLSLADAVVIGSSAQSNINAVLGTGTPVITSFSVPATSASFTVSGITLTANDGNGVAGYMITESATAPEASATGWSSTAPTSYKFTTIGTKTLYAWAKGSTGLVSTSSQATVTISSAAMRTGDCDGSGSVSIAEVQSAINMYLGMKTVEQCVDQDNSGTASIAEVQKAINSFLGL